MSSNFNLYSKYYNLLYADKDYISEAGYIQRLIKKYSPKGKTILELGSGTGKHGLELKKNGYDVFGIERSEGMVAEAKANGFDCTVGDITKFTVKKKFNVALSLFHVISYLNVNDQLLKCFKKVNDHLTDGGIFIFDVWYSPAVYLQKPEVRIKRMKDKDLSVTRIAEPVIDVNRNVVDVRYTVFAQEAKSKIVEELKESHPMRHFSIPEIDLLSSQTGFIILKAEEFLSGNDPGENTWGVCFILKKK